MNTAEFLNITSSILPDRLAIVCGDESRTYGQLQERVNRLANVLQSYGVKQGDRVAAMDVNSIRYVETYYACAKVGAVLVPLNYRAKSEEIAYMLNVSETCLLFVGKRYISIIEEIQPELRAFRQAICYDGYRAGFANYETVVMSQTPNEVFVEVHDNDPTILLYTSGTTAMPKGVVLTYLSMSVYVTNTVEPANPEVHDVLLLSVPIFHIAGATAIMSSVWGGRTLTVLPQFDEEAWLDAVQERRVTHSFIVPTMLKRIMDHPKFESYDLSSLQLLAYGAAPMPWEVITRAIKLFDCGLMNAYGQTESTSTLTFLGPDDHIIPDGPTSERDKQLRRLRSVGRPMEDVVIGIMDPAGQLLPTGQEGEIVAQGPRLMSGYWKQDNATHDALKDGWLHTGDVGWMDEDGYLYITGRTKDVIIRGGENIAPGEIEAVLEKHPKVEEAAVIGVPDIEWGEEVKAIAVLRPAEKATPAELTEHCKSRLASYKAPKYYAFLEELPRNYLGKVLKTELRKRYGKAQDEL